MGMSFNGRQIKHREIDKNLHFVGACGPNQMAMGACLTTSLRLPSDCEGAQVTFEDLWFKVGGNYTTLLLLNSSDITCKQVLLKQPLRQIMNFYL